VEFAFNGQVIVNNVPSIFIGGIAEDFGRAANTEAAMVSRDLRDPNTLIDVMNSLDREVNPVETVGSVSASYKKHLAKSLVYKVMP